MNFPFSKYMLWAFLLGLSILLNSACQREEGCLDASATNYDVSADLNCCCEYPVFEFRIFRVAGSADYSPDSAYVDAGNNAFSIADVRFYISEVHLVNDSGTEVGVTDSIGIEKLDGSGALVEDNFIRVNPDQNLYELGTILTQGNFNTVRFTVGLAEDVNHGNPDIFSVDHPLAIQSDSLHIDQQSGYKFNAMDIVISNDTTSYFVSGDQNAVELEIDYDITAVKAFDVEVQIDVDLLALLDGVDFSVDDFNTIQSKIVNNTPAAFTKH